MDTPYNPPPSIPWGHNKYLRVADQHIFNADPDPTFFQMRIRISSVNFTELLKKNKFHINFFSFTALVVIVSPPFFLGIIIYKG